MRIVYFPAIVALCLTTGCRTASNLGHEVPVANTFEEQDRVAEELSPSADQVHEKPIAQQAPTRKLQSLPPVNELPSVQLVDFQQESVDPPPMAPESLPVSPDADSLASNLSLNDLESIALQNNPVLAEVSARVQAAQGNWQQVGLKPNPVVGYAGEELGTGGVASKNGIFLGQKFITGKKLQLNREKASWEVQQIQRELETAELRVLTDVRIGYYEVLIAQHRRELAAELVSISVQGVDTAEALFQAQEVSQADPLRASIEADNARILLQTATNQHLEAWQRLTAVLGMPELSLQRLAGDLNPESLDLSWQATLQRIMNESPELAAANANVQATRWAIERAYAEVIPDLTVQAVVQDNRGTDSVIGGLQVKLPLPLWNRNQGGIRQAYWNATAAERAADRLTMDLKSRLATAFQRYASARNQVEQYSRDEGLLDKSQRTLDLIRTGYKADEFGALELLSAQRTYFQTNLAYLDAQRELWTAAMEIRGLLLRGSLSP